MGYMKRSIVRRAGIVVLALTISASSMLGAPVAAAPNDGATWTLDCIDLAAMHLEYLLLDEVLAGGGPAVYADIDRAAARLEYLSLPEVALERTCGDDFVDA